LAKNKRKKFEELKTFKNVFENFSWDDPKVLDDSGKKIELKGNWNKDVFKNDNPIILELACGQGDYTRSMAREFPNNNFIGVDIKGNRIWSAATRSFDLPNVAFLRTSIEVLDSFFSRGETNECWITFPDPFKKSPKHKRRLTSKRFLGVYRKVLNPGGIVHLKTDSDLLYDYTKEILEEEQIVPEEDIADLYSEVREDQRLYIKTYYEKMHLAEGRTIKYIRFRL